MPEIQGPSQPPVPVLRSRVLDECQFTLERYTQHANCSEVTRTIKLANATPFNFVAGLHMVVEIQGYRVWTLRRTQGQHGQTITYLVSPRLREDGVAGLPVLVLEG